MYIKVLVEKAEEPRYVSAAVWCEPVMTLFRIKAFMNTCRVKNWKIFHVCVLSVYEIFRSRVLSSTKY